MLVQNPYEKIMADTMRVINPKDFDQAVAAGGLVVQGMKLGPSFFTWGSAELQTRLSAG